MDYSDRRIIKAKVRIVHMDGPRQGDIDELEKDVIRIGRDPDNDVIIPRELRIVSRHHAEIVRENSHFRLISHGRNGCIVRGKNARIAALRQGDWITLGEGGPKISFLRELVTEPLFEPMPNAEIVRQQYGTDYTDRDLPPDLAAAQRRALPNDGEFVLQFGENTRILNKTIVKVGSDPRQADFRITHNEVLPMHIELVHRTGQYFLRKPVRSAVVTLNTNSVENETLLQPGDIIGMGKYGVEWLYYGDGNFVDVDYGTAKKEKQKETSESDKPQITPLIATLRELDANPRKNSLARLWDKIADRLL